jgi:ABC-type uncharacterized transport system substrate-binding protein
MKRKITVLAFSTMFFAFCFPVQAQQPKKIPRIGFVSGGSANDPGPGVNAFRQGLRDLGYVEGKNLVIEYRFAEDKPDRLPTLVAELVGLKVDLIFAPSTNAALAAKSASQTIPIVFASAADPLANELVASLARPGGNLTGPSQMSAELSGKRLELIKEVVPRLSRVAVLRDHSPQSEVALKETQLAAQALAVQLKMFEVRSPNDFEGVFLSMSKERPGALVVISSPMVLNNRGQIIALVTKQRLPAVYTLKEYVDAGGLMSYGVSLPALFRRAATYVDKILKGAKPADLPVEQPTKFEFVINLKTARQIGLTIPPNVLARADKVIK